MLLDSEAIVHLGSRGWRKDLRRAAFLCSVLSSALALILLGASAAVASPISELDLTASPDEIAGTLDPANPPTLMLIPPEAADGGAQPASEPLTLPIAPATAEPPEIELRADPVDVTTREPTPPSERSLRGVMRSMATIHHWFDLAPNRGAQRVQVSPSGSYRDDDGIAETGLVQLVLDSQMAGAALRSVVDVRATDGEYTEFSVLGMGDFVLELDTDTQQSAVMSELSSGFSATLTHGRDAAGRLDLVEGSPGAGDADYGRERVNYFRFLKNWIIDIALSPVGILTWMVVTIVILMRAALKIVHAWNASVERGSAARMSRRVRRIERRKAKNATDRRSRGDRVHDGQDLPIVRAASE